MTLYDNANYFLLKQMAVEIFLRNIFQNIEHSSIWILEKFSLLY